MTTEPPGNLVLGRNLKPPAFAQTFPRSSGSNSTSKKGIWEILGLGATFLSRLWYVCWEGSLELGATLLKLISNKTQPPGSHQSEGKGACDIPGVAPGRSGTTQHRPEAVCPAVLWPKGLPGGNDSGLVWAKPPCTAWLWSLLSCYFRPGGQCQSLPSAGFCWLKYQPGMPGPLLQPGKWV